jgi:DNA-binding transcriptional MerR regulator
MDWSIQDIARLAGTTSRTLRHYGDVGLLPASRVGANGYRYYDETALVRLQRILMLRDLGLGIPAIAEVLAGQTDDAPALEAHLEWLRQEQNRIDRQIASVERTINTLKGTEPLMAADMFDGFNHAEYKEEVEQRWGGTAYADGDRWWRAKTAAEKAEWQRLQKELAADWSAAAAAGLAPGGPEAQALATRHADWLAGIPGTPQVDGRPDPQYLIGLGEMYVADDRFSANYGGVEGATFVRDALRVYAGR